jgi:hypothetical protein
VLLHGINGILTRGMERGMFTAAGLISGAPAADEHPRCHPRSRPRPMLIIAGRPLTNPTRPVVPGHLTRHRAGLGGAGRRAHPGSGQRTLDLGSRRVKFPDAMLKP